MQLSRKRGFFPLRSAAALLVTVAPLASLAACGDSSTEPVAKELDFELFGDAYRDAQCARAVSCRLMPDADTCKATLRSDRWVAEAVAAVSFGDLTYDPKAGQSCVDTLATYTCESFELIPDGVREVCDPVFGNRRGQDEACKSTAQCEGVNSTCEGGCGGGCCEGLCKGAAALGQENEECGEELPECGEDLRCQFDDVEMLNLCKPLAGPNEPCSEGQCIDGYACDGGTAKCFKQALTGASCNPLLANACASRGEFCDVDTSKCIALPVPGEACATNTTLANTCAAYAFCDGTACQTLPTVGEDCLGEFYCIGSLECGEDPNFTCLALPGPDVCLNL
jgi:hypothetical protein